MHFGEISIETDGEQNEFEVQLFLNGIDPDWVRVELYADGRDGEAPVRHEMTRARSLIGSVNGYAYGASVSASRPPSDYTPRVVPRYSGASIPLEASQILWQR